MTEQRIPRLTVTPAQARRLQARLAAPPAPAAPPSERQVLVAEVRRRLAAAERARAGDQAPAAGVHADGQMAALAGLLDWLEGWMFDG